VPLPESLNILIKNKNRALGKSHHLNKFIRGKIISGSGIKRGRRRLPNPPIKAGITTKKIIIIA